MEGLICGNDNCPTTFGFDPKIDCCLLPSLDLDCTSEIPCGQNEGDCNSHDECQAGLACGTDNCPASLGFDSEIDCCYQPILGDEDYCTSGIPCDEDEGDCDAHDECQDGLFCGSNNCPASLGYASEVDCCTEGMDKIRKFCM